MVQTGALIDWGFNLCNVLKLHATPPSTPAQSYSAPPRGSANSAQYPAVFAHIHTINRLVEWVGSGAPVCKEHTETDSFKQAGQNTNCNSVERSLLCNNTGNDLGNVSIVFVLDRRGLTYTWSSGGHEDQRTEVGSTLVA